MNLREISAALQRGESLTGTQKAEAICALRGWQFQLITDDGFTYKKPPGNEVRFCSQWLFDNESIFTSVDAALAFVAEVFPDRARVYFRIESNSYGTWNATIATNPMKAFDVFGVASAPTPSAAIMADAIEAHLAKGGE